MTHTRLLRSLLPVALFLAACSAMKPALLSTAPAETPTFPPVAPPVPSAAPEGISQPTTAFAPLQTPIPLESIVRSLPATPLSTLPKEAVTNIAVAPDGAVWFSYGDFGAYLVSGGVYRYDGRDLTHFPNILGDADDLGGSVQTLEVAPDGTVWAGARGKVARFSGQSWQAILTDCQCTSGLVSDFAFTPDGNVWIATMHNLFRFDGQSLSTYDRLANRLAVARDGSLWVSGWEGRQDSEYVARFDGANWTTYYMAESRQGWVGNIVPGPDGLLWGVARPCNHGACPFELAAFDGQSWTKHSVAVTPRTEFYIAAVAPDGALWINTDIGLVRFDGKQWLADRNALKAAAVAVAPDGSLWVGTYEGQVFHYEPTLVPVAP